MAEYNAIIEYSPSIYEGDESGWYWEVRVDGKSFADPVYLEKSRIMAEAMVLKYMAKALAIEERDERSTNLP